MSIPQSQKSETAYSTTTFTDGIRETGIMLESMDLSQNMKYNTSSCDLKMRDDKMELEHGKQTPSDINAESTMMHTFTTGLEHGIKELQNRHCEGTPFIPQDGSSIQTNNLEEQNNVETDSPPGGRGAFTYISPNVSQPITIPEFIPEVTSPVAYAKSPTRRNSQLSTESGKPHRASQSQIGLNVGFNSISLLPQENNNDTEVPESII